MLWTNLLDSSTETFQYYVLRGMVYDFLAENNTVTTTTSNYYVQVNKACTTFVQPHGGGKTHRTVAYASVGQSQFLLSNAIDCDGINNQNSLRNG